MAMDMAQGPEKHDSVYEQNGLTFFLEKEAQKILMHATIDYTEKQGFMITGIPPSSCCG